MRLTIQGQTCNFLSDSYSENKYMRGGMLEEPVTLEVGERTFIFSTLYLCSKSENIYGGILAFTHKLEIGKSRNIVPAFSVYFYFGGDGEIESVYLAADTTLKVGLNEYTFSSTTDLTDGFLSFHPNGEIMRANFAEPVHIDIQGTKILSQTVSFWEDNKIAAIVPFHNTYFKGYEFLGRYGDHNFCHYSMAFTQNEELSFGVLSNGSQISFPEGHFLSPTARIRK